MPGDRSTDVRAANKQVYRVTQLFSIARTLVRVYSLLDVLSFSTCWLERMILEWEMLRQEGYRIE